MRIRRKYICKYNICTNTLDKMHCINENSQHFGEITEGKNICPNCPCYVEMDVDMTLAEALQVVFANSKFLSTYRDCPEDEDVEGSVLFCTGNNNEDVIRFNEAVLILKAYAYDEKECDNAEHSRNQTIGEIVSAAREAKHLSQRALAKEVKISNATINRIENPNDPIKPDPATLRKIADRLSVDYYLLLRACGYIGDDLYQLYLESKKK